MSREFDSVTGTWRFRIRSDGNRGCTCKCGCGFLSRLGRGFIKGHEIKKYKTKITHHALHLECELTFEEIKELIGPMSRAVRAAR